MPNDSTKRFSSRVENYVKYRPGYPKAVVEFLAKECGITASSLVADVGSGTGKLTEPFLGSGFAVVGVEPNREMREAAEKLLKDYPRFQSVDGTAEATTLADGSVDLVVAGQAFHWFKREPTRKEFLRVLKPDGWVALIWNDRSVSASPFLKAYENLLVTYATEYRSVNHKNLDAGDMGAFFGAAGFKRVTFPNRQVFDWAGLQGRLLSSSYAPEAGHENHGPMMEALRKIFGEYQVDGEVVFECDTLVYYGRLEG